MIKKNINDLNTLSDTSNKVNINNNSHYDSYIASNNNEECCICFYPINYKHYKDHSEHQPIILSCDHIFHYRCLLTWGKNCPLCRSNISNVMRFRILAKCYIKIDNLYKSVKFYINYLDSLYVLLQFIQECSEINLHDLILHKISICRNGENKHTYLFKSNIKNHIRIRDILNIPWNYIGYKDYLHVILHGNHKLQNKILKYPNKFGFKPYYNTYNDHTYECYLF